MAKKCFVKLLVTVTALWCAGNLGILALRLRCAAAEAEALSRRREETGQALTRMEQQLSDPEGMLRELGYVKIGDTVFFDGG